MTDKELAVFSCKILGQVEALVSPHHSELFNSEDEDQLTNEQIENYLNAADSIKTEVLFIKAEVNSKKLNGEYLKPSQDSKVLEDYFKPALDKVIKNMDFILVNEGDKNAGVYKEGFWDSLLNLGYYMKTMNEEYDLELEEWED